MILRAAVLINTHCTLGMWYPTSPQGHTQSPEPVPKPESVPASPATSRTEIDWEQELLLISILSIGAVDQVYWCRDQHIATGQCVCRGFTVRPNQPYTVLIAILPSNNIGHEGRSVITDQ